MKNFSILFFLLCILCLGKEDIIEVAIEEDGEIDKPFSEETYQCKKEYIVPTPNCKIEYLETFQGDSMTSGKWLYSYQREFGSQSWIWGYGYKKPTLDCDKALITEYPATRYGIATLFDKPVTMQEEDLVVQYEVRYQKGLECGGAYIKLLRDGSIKSAQDLTSDTPYVIMFGPDFCGGTNRVHVIIPHYNPVSKKWVEKHLEGGPRAVIDDLTHLYTLIIRKDDTIEILIDQINKFTGNLNTDFQPPFSSPATIADPTDKKPANWVEVERIRDPTDKKPDDWDETQPKFIVDESAVKPEDWLDDEPLEIPDPSAVVPEDWDEEEYGPFEAPMIPNPRCEEVSGCGPWEKPTIPNPLYKGIYQYRSIPNPLYRGPWLPRFIPNPDYYEEKAPHNLPAISGIAIEIWTVQEGIAFDNILITHDEHCAEAFADATFRLKHKKELIENPQMNKRRTIPVAENKEEEDIPIVDEEEWVVKRKARMSFTRFVNNMIDETFHWDYDEERFQIVEKSIYGILIVFVVLVCVVYYTNREFLHKAKIL